jgi:phospholipase/carboxylesterase
MLSSPLPLVEVNPSSKPVAVVIWLHGLGADGHDFEPVVPALQLPEALPVRFIFPHAPEMAITAFGGERARAWFDFETSGSSAMPGIDRSAHAIKDLIQQEIDNGIPADRILLRAEALELDDASSAANRNIPILMCHGQRDEVLPLSLGESTYRALQQAGYNIEWHDYPMGHEVCLEEIRIMGRWLLRVLSDQEISAD